MTTTQWIVGLIDRLTEPFPQTGFAYAYELLNDQHVVELSDAETFGSEPVRLVLCKEWERFRDAFPEEDLLFIGPDDVFAVENAIYRVSVKSTDFSLMTLDVSAETILGSVEYGRFVRQLPVVVVGQFEPATTNYAYAMAA